MTLVRVERVSKRYMLGDQVLWALRDVSLTIEEGVFLAIAGPSGSGKSTLLNLVGCLDTPTRGKVVLDGHDTGTATPNQLAALRARMIGFIFQTFNLFPVLTAEENVEYPLLQFPELDRNERRERVARALDVVKLAEYAGHRPNQLSGGQRQRVAIARALATRPRLILADEPTANLDHTTGEEILELMKDVNRRQGTTFVFSTHDKKVIAKADRLVRIEDGRLRALGIRTSSRWTLARERSSRPAARKAERTRS
jgi:putative ABC transport system ATP-binding protein